MIVVLTYGKVSSISLFRMLQAAFPGDVYYSHGRQPAVMQVIDAFCVASPAHGAAMKADAFKDNIEIDRRLALARTNGQPVTIVTGIRDPVARSLSASLQVLDTMFADCKAATAEETAARLVTALREIWADDSYATDPVRRMASLAIRAPLEWLQCEIEQPLGLDLLSADFDAQAGYHIYESGNVSLLLYRAEDAPRAIETGLGALFPERRFRLPRANVTDDKGQAELYTLLKNGFSLSADVLDAIYGNRYIAHFLSPAEISAAKARWVRSENGNLR